MNLVAILSLLLVTGHIVLAENTYAAYVPKYIRPGVEYSIDIEMLDYPETIDVEAKLMSDDYSSSATAQISEEARTANLAFDTIPYGYDGSTDFNVTIVGKNSETGVKVFSNETKNIQYQKKFLSIFIQTDKAIYQPGHIIKFRAVVTTPELFPYGGTASYRLQDPSGNTILKQTNAQLTQGVVGSQFKLGKYSTLGDWKIIYQVHGYEESISVSVEEYKLPKFNVDLKTDQSFLHPGSKVLTGELSATYTFGQPVRGSAVVEITINKYWRRKRKASKIVVQFPEFDGSKPFDIDVKDKIEGDLEWNPKSWSPPLTITAKVTDKNTGETYQETTTVDLHRVKMKVETLAKPDHIKAGLPYVAYLKISQQDGSRLDAEDLEDLRMEIHADYNYAYDRILHQQRHAKTDIVNFTVRADGLIVFKTISSADDFNSVYFNVKIPTYPDKYQHWASWRAERFRSPSNTFLQVSIDDTTLAAGDTAKLTIYTTEKSHAYRISFLARGKVLMNELYQPSMYDDKETYSSFNYSFMVKLEHSPSVFAVVSFVRDDGEFIADTVKINVQAALDNEVTMTTFPNKTDAGMPVIINVHAEAGSFVGLRAIDQSVLLLKSGNDITRAKIFQDLEQYGPTGGSGNYPRWGGWWWPWSVGGADVSEVFENSGFIVLSDGVVYKAQWEWEYDDGPVAVQFADYGAESMLNQFDDADEMSTLPPKQKASKTRSYFPESWIWTESTAGDDGSITFNYNVPDTITTWELSSFAVSDNKGLGVTKENLKITVFRNFFISLDLPPSIVRGEILKMKTTVFNYFDQELTATVTLTDNDWYDIISIEKRVEPAGVRTITIPSKDSVTVVFSIEFMKIGNARILIRADSALAADQVERTLRVKPEGIPKIVSHSSIIDRQDENEPATVVNFDVDIPSDAVEGSAYVKFSVSGNILGNALSNLGNLLKMPSGCGEQTMLSFAPDVYISLYLKKVDELTGNIKQKSESHIREGYQNELRYQRKDGSFSAFGPSDGSGSTWLTAFVAKCFIAANELNPDLIEEKKIEQAVNFILEQQNDDGTFEEPGRVLHKSMQSGVDSDDTTAAYMLIALTEGGAFKKNQDIQVAIAKTQLFLEGRIDQIRDIYTLSIVGYALSLVESAEAGNVLNIIDSMATTQANVKYWEIAETGAAKCEGQINYCPFDSDQPSSSSIEITAYVLLTYIKVGRINEVMPTVRWLVQQRGAFGGYHSTQDTVMAIPALSTVAGFFSERTLDLDINVAHSGQEDFGAHFLLSDENSIVLQMTELPSVSGNVAVTGTGRGFADVQVTVGYNLPVGPRSDEPFVVDVKVKKIVDEVKMEVCSRINENRQEVVNGTGMYVVTFTLPSGHTVDGKKATKDNDDTKLVEVVGEEVTGYFDELPRGRTICMTLVLIRYAEVEGVKPKLIRAYDYYSPKISAMRMVALPPEKECPPCTSDYTVPCCVGPGPLLEEPLIVVDDRPSYCRTETYPCPEFVDGLFYDSSSHIEQLITRYPDGNPCRAPEGAGDSRSHDGLPASRLNGVDQYIECSGTSYFDNMLRNRDGWTISIVIHPMKLQQPKYYTIFSIGSEEAKRPYVILAKKPRKSQFWMKILLRGQQMIVRKVLTSDVPVNGTSLITARLDGTKPSLFVNGVKKGRFTRRNQTTEDLEGEITLKVGRSHVGKKIETRGYFEGLVSSLDAWLKPLTDEEIRAHYNYWQASITGENPSLDVAKVKHIVPPSIRKCFDKAYFAEDLKSRAGGLRTDCDEPNGPPPPPQDEE